MNDGHSSLRTAAPSQWTEGAEHREKIKVLIVDDRPENLLALEAMLDEPEYELMPARSGPEALKLLLKHDVALILLDVFMPEMDGFEVAATIKKRERTKHIPIIFLTAMAKEIGHIYRAYSVGAVDYIQKPLEPAVVKAKVAVFADLYRKTEQIKEQAETIRQIELREKERELEATRVAGEKRYQDLVEGIDQGVVWTADQKSGKFTYISPRCESFIGCAARDLNQSVMDFVDRYVDPRDRESVLNVLRNAQPGHDTRIEHRLIRSDGEEIWVQTGVRLASKGTTQELELRGITFDITPLKRTEQALREAVRSRDEFLSIASHELRTPLTPLKLQIQNMIRGLEKEIKVVPDETRLLKSLTGWDKQVGRLSRLVETLLDVSRISAGKLELHREQMDLAELAGEVVERFSEESSAAHCEIQLVREAPVIGNWDRLRIDQVVSNLISNALKYGQGKPILVSVSSRGGSAELSVKDSGVGIPEEDQDRVFNRFERAISSTTVSGLGLGLYIANQIVSAHEGKITVRSKSGYGSTFSVVLPQQGLKREVGSGTEAAAG